MVKVPGYKNASVSFKKKEATVTFDPTRTNPEELARMLAKETSYTVAVKPKKEKAKPE